MSSRIGRIVSGTPLHVAALASFAIAQPLFDVLGNAPEFLLAHDLGPAEILGAVFIIGALVPALAGAIIWVLDRVHPASSRGIAFITIFVFGSLVAVYALKARADNPWIVVAGAVLAGLMASVAYRRIAGVRAFAAWLTPGIVVFPLLFLLRPGVQSLMWPPDTQIAASATTNTPVVMVVFDGLPLTALLDQDYQFDRTAYPSFAALAGQSTWYRNATTVSDYTRWAVPAMLTGRYPVAEALPIASDHPESIFTLLGGSHNVQIYEPISRLCPETVCEHQKRALLGEMIDFAEVIAVVYLHTVLPEAFESGLPPVNQGWTEGVPPTLSPGELWLREGDRGRRGELLDFIDSLDAGGVQPPFYFVHALLPHTPLVYFPDGQRYSNERYLPGLLERRDRWRNDEWAVAQGYQLFLLQVGYVDTLLGQLMSKLKQLGIFDRALIVITADHGASFRAGQPFRGVSDATFMDILPIPLLIKEPHQQKAAISDRNVETVDILPTLTDILRVRVPWRIDGVSATSSTASRAAKIAYYDDARRRRSFGSSLVDHLRSAVDRKVALFGPSEANYYRVPRSSPHHELIGREVGSLRTTEDAEGLEFSTDIYGDFADVDPDGTFVPAYLAGRARWTDRRDPASLAVAVNGTIRATTRTYQFEEKGSRYAWSVVLPADAFRRGPNNVEVFVFGAEAGETTLHRVFTSGSRTLDLMSDAAAYALGVRVRGFYRREGALDSAFRWTGPNATIIVPPSRRPAPRSLRIELAMTGEGGKQVRLLFDGCELFNGSVPMGQWSAVFSLAACPAGPGEHTIELHSDTHRDPKRTRDLGVAVRRIDLLDYDWPPSGAPLPDAARQSQIELKGVDAATPVPSTSQLDIRVVNRGSEPWANPEGLKREDGSVRVGVLWHRAGYLASPAAVQRVELPRSLLPGDAVDFSFRLVPAAADGTRLPPGEYELWIGLLQEGVNWFYTSGDSVRKLRVIHDAGP